jgi:hypothetical protein
VIGTDIQNTTLPEKKAAKVPEGKRREMLKAIIVNRVKREAGYDG